MARIKKGKLKGKLGSVVACQWKGKPYLRAKGQRTVPPTQGEQANRYVFDLVNEWLKPVQDFVRLGFRNYSETVWGINAASSMLHRTALYRDGFDSTIEPHLVQVSHGSIGLPADLEVSLDNDQLQFYWSTETGQDKDQWDRIALLAYNIKFKTVAYNLSGPQRFQGYASLSLHPIEPGPYHIYAAFTSMEEQSNSRYLGVVSV